MGILLAGFGCGRAYGALLAQTAVS